LPAFTYLPGKPCPYLLKITCSSRILQFIFKFHHMLLPTKNEFRETVLLHYVVHILSNGGVAVMHLSFHRNLGNIDRTIRIIAGVVLICLAVFNPLIVSGWLILLLGVFGLAMIIEGLMAY